MKAYFDSHGLLNIQAENELERFALKHWCKDWFKSEGDLPINSGGLLIRCDYKELEGGDA